MCGFYLHLSKIEFVLILLFRLKKKQMCLLQSSFSENVSANLCGIIAKVGTLKYLKQQKLILTFEKNKSSLKVFYYVSIYIYKKIIRKVVRGAASHFQENEWNCNFIFLNVSFFIFLNVIFSLTSRWQNFTPNTKINTKKQLKSNLDNHLSDFFH